MRHFHANEKGSTDRLLCEIPKRIAVFGSKPRDLEAVQSFHMMGSEVTLIESGPQLLHEANREIAQRLSKLRHDARIAIKRDVAVEAIRRGDDGTLVVVLVEGKCDVTAGPIRSHKANVEGIIAGENAMGLTSKKEA